jgi:hypothetical protein
MDASQARVPHPSPLLWLHCCIVPLLRPLFSQSEWHTGLQEGSCHYSDIIDKGAQQFCRVVVAVAVVPNCTDSSLPTCRIGITK